MTSGDRYTVLEGLNTLFPLSLPARKHIRRALPPNGSVGNKSSSWASALDTVQHPMG